LYMGVQQTYGGMARVIYPLVAGIASDHIGEASPFWISGALILSTIAIGSGLGGFRRREQAADLEGAAKVMTAVK